MRLALALAWVGLLPRAAPFSLLSVPHRRRDRLGHSGGRHERSFPAARCIVTVTTCRTLAGGDWSNFAALEDEDDGRAGPPRDAGAAPSSAALYDGEDDVPPVRVPAGSQLGLDEETVRGVLSACREELGTLFGYTAENRGVGITGRVDFVGLDGPAVILRLSGRYWHQRTTVLDRVANYLQQRIPEIIDVSVEDPWQLTDEANE